MAELIISTRLSMLLKAVLSDFAESNMRACLISFGAESHDEVERLDLITGIGI